MSRLARILDPQSVPVLGTDAHLPAVPADRLTASALRERFARAGAWQPARAFDDVHADDHGVAGRKGRNGLVQASNFFLLEGCDQVHGFLQ